MAAELRNLSNGEAVDQRKLRSAQTTTLDKLGSDDVALDLVGARGCRRVSGTCPGFYILQNLSN
jgi:hypothetical protein